MAAWFANRLNNSTSLRETPNLFAVEDQNHADHLALPDHRDVDNGFDLWIISKDGDPACPGAVISMISGSPVCATIPAAPSPYLSMMPV
jgi:hypothetical protein